MLILTLQGVDDELDFVIVEVACRANFQVGAIVVVAWRHFLFDQLQGPVAVSGAWVVGRDHDRI